MTDRSIAIAALVVALVALAFIVAHAFTRDEVHGGIAHERGFFATGRFSWDATLRRDPANIAIAAEPPTVTPQLTDPPRIIGAPGIVPLPTDLGVDL